MTPESSIPMTDNPLRFFSLQLRPWAWGLLKLSGAIATIATIFGFLGSFSWFFDLFSHFRVQYLLGLLTLGVIMWLGSHRKTAVFFLVFSLVNLGVALPLYFGRQTIDPLLSPLRAMLINVNSSLGDAARVRTVIEAENPDILVLEEISSRWLGDLTWLTNTYPHCLIEPREDNFGIALYSKLPLRDSQIVYVGEADVPTIIATVQLKQKDLYVVATHPLPPLGKDYTRLRNGHLEQLPKILRSPHPILLLGDLNLTPWNNNFQKLLNDTGLQDSTKGFGYQPSWPSQSPVLLIPLDHCLHSKEISILNRRIGKSVSSDHYPLIVDFVITK
jgi:endonuclease/exonuclease/phosphatase (EEP) superfamily protein YafD